MNADSINCLFIRLCFCLKLSMVFELLNTEPSQSFLQLFKVCSIRRKPRLVWQTSQAIPSSHQKGFLHRILLNLLQRDDALVVLVRELAACLLTTFAHCTERPCANQRLPQLPAHFSSLSVGHKSPLVTKSLAINPGMLILISRNVATNGSFPPRSCAHRRGLCKRCRRAIQLSIFPRNRFACLGFLHIALFLLLVFANLAPASASLRLWSCIASEVSTCITHLRSFWSFPFASLWKHISSN